MSRGQAHEFQFEQATLLVVDLISDYAFPDGEALAKHARCIARAVTKLAVRFREHERPVIYVNDNYGRWRSNFNEWVNWAQASTTGHDIVATVQPHPDDYFVLKPRHSAFYETPLPSLLESCISAVWRSPASLAIPVSCIRPWKHSRKLGVWAPEDGAASVSNGRNERAIACIRESMEGATAPIDHH
ncbi:cysteine hydrolase [Dyella jejuensis]|uniref:Cysteine hydrolase n=1 Tax=Dyella jejuensis TaxID=1432009 RepID=A0ABW8JHQ1_9GAMM